MPPQEKNIKGFSILELLVVLALVAIISGAAYPNFSEWNKERAVRSDVDKIAALIKNTYTQTERGALAYVQIYFNQTDDGLFVEGRGLTMSTLATKINNGDDDWNDTDKIGERCDPGPVVTATTENANWDTHKTDAPAEISNLVYDITVKDVTTTFDGTAAICFSRNGKFYGGDETHIAADGAPINFILLCSAKRSNDCNIGDSYGANKDIKIICDSADTLGAKLFGKSNGAYCDAAITSFYGSHVINGAGNGGMLVFFYLVGEQTRIGINRIR